MKRITISLLVGMMISCTYARAQKLEFKEHITKEFVPTKTSGSTLAIYNVNGFIRVEGYSGDKVIVEIDKTISAKESQILDQGKEEFKLVMEQHADSIVAYISDPFDSRPNRNQRNWNDRKKFEYKFDLDFTVKVPYSMNLHVSTVNGGEVLVTDVTGSLGVYNVNGAIKVSNARGKAEMRTVNGNVDANFVTVAPGGSSFKTINGDIRLTYPSSLSAECEFKSFRGDFFTDFPDAVALPSTVTKNETKDKNKTIYKLDNDSAIRIGSGVPNKLKMETFNGNIYIKKQS